MSTNIRTHTYIHSVVLLFLVLWLVFCFVFFVCFVFVSCFVTCIFVLFFFVCFLFCDLYIFLFFFVFFLFYLSFLPSSVIAWILVITLSQTKESTNFFKQGCIPTCIWRLCLSAWHQATSKVSVVLFLYIYMTLEQVFHACRPPPQKKTRRASLFHFHPTALSFCK